VQLAGRRVLLEEYTKAIQMGMFTSMNRLRLRSDPLVRTSHVDLVDRLKTRGPEFAEKVMRDNLRSGKSRIFDGIGIR
jgi:DNA-binding GntR family transcriptional regulator